jgi:NAD(P)-dependent dehydrogenase (short-subunit alcohol dehydrogenase family)
LENVVNEIVATGGEAIAVQHDVINEEQWNEVVKLTVSTYGKLDALVIYCKHFFHGRSCWWRCWYSLYRLKGAIRLLSKDAAVELGPDNIRVNSVHPWFIDTPMVSIVTENEKATKAAILGIPLGRAAQPEEVANLVLFLAF